MYYSSQETFTIDGFDHQAQETGYIEGCRTWVCIRGKCERLQTHKNQVGETAWVPHIERGSPIDRCYTTDGQERQEEQQGGVWGMECGDEEEFVGVE